MTITSFLSRTNEKNSMNPSLWLFMDATNNLFIVSMILLNLLNYSVIKSSGLHKEVDISSGKGIRRRDFTNAL